MLVMDGTRESYIHSFGCFIRHDSYGPYSSINTFDVSWGSYSVFHPFLPDTYVLNLPNNYVSS
ncbi:integron integrase [Shigella phage SSP1]|uniref:Integron integrase n=1 Tax=Shigella phage SSP1 TaxID=1983588 RepID=A0A2K8GPS4_9CAUD|nr:hypothetical protein HOS34_gp155 [Shigella phage SSP1]ASD50198.1 integron integrase [Shigella phage SSP1]